MNVFPDVGMLWRGRSRSPDGAASNGRIDAAELLASAIGGERWRDATLPSLGPHRAARGRVVRWRVGEAHNRAARAPHKASSDEGQTTYAFRRPGTG
jgi:hypothetical protein